MPKVREDKIVGVVTKIASKMIPKKVFNRPLLQQVEMVKMFMAFPVKMGGGMGNIRSSLLKEDGIAGDVGEMLKAGKTPEEIKSYFWDCKPWRELWVDTMKCEEGMLDLIIKQEVIKRGEV